MFRSRSFLLSFILCFPALTFAIGMDPTYCVNIVKVVPEKGKCPFAVGGYSATQVLDRKIGRFVSTVGDDRFIYDGSVALPSNSELIQLRAWGMFVAKHKSPVKFSETIAKEPRRESDQYDPAMRGWVIIPSLNCRMRYVTSHACSK
ncbi:MAG: hypothetical protein CMF39_05935 [Legionellaceae bacterium]|nr:hypothetical protein [Legionellaceae bacterium]